MMERSPLQTLGDLLERAALSHPQRGLTFVNAGAEYFLSYNDLLSQAQANGNRLRCAGIVENGSIVALCFDSHISNVIWTWSVLAAGGTPAILPPLSNDPKTRQGQLQNLRTLFGKPCVLTSQSMIDSLAGLQEASIHNIADLSIPERKAAVADYVFGHGAHSRSSCAVLLFTSGSTGHSKAIEFTHHQLITSVRAKQSIHDLNYSVNFMSWVSFDHSAHFCELHLNAMNVGANQYLVPTLDVAHQPAKFIEMLGTYQIGYTFSSNSFLAAACKAWKQREDMAQVCDLSKLKVVMVGGEANKVASLQQADAIFRTAGAQSNAIKAAYGLSETCSACFYGLQTPGWDLEQGNAFATVGKLLPIGLEFRLVDEELDSVPQGEDGKIQLRGDIVFQRYYNNHAATSSCMTSDGWFDTGDLGRLDSLGNLAIVGRSKEILILGGNNYSSFELEHAIESRGLPGVSVSWTATFSIWDDKNNTEGVVVLFSPAEDAMKDPEQLKATISGITKAVLMFCSTAPLDVVPLPKKEMPKSSIGKLSRQKLKQFYQEGQFDLFRVKRNQANRPVRSKQLLATAMQRTIAGLLAEAINVPADQIGADDELGCFGMSSITYLRLKRSLEVATDRVGNPIYMGSFLEARTVADVAVLAEDSQTSEYQPLVTLRAEGSKPPLFLFPPAGGQFLIWMPILRFLPDRPVYTFQVKGLERHSEGTFDSIQDMLDTYESAILSAHPTGPYALLGLCFGSISAFEIGKRLESRGHTLSLCAGLDAPPNLRNVLRFSSDRANAKDFLIDLLVYHNLISDDEVPALETRYAGLQEQDAVVAISEDFRDSGLPDAGLHAGKIESWYRVNRFAYRVAEEYIPTGMVGRYDIFWANPYMTWGINVKDWEETLKTWDAFSRESCTYRWVPGHHYSLFKDDNVQALADALVAVMDEREKSSVEVGKQAPVHVAVNEIFV